ncbi:hypothetical protein NB640_00810 [Oxalobacter vibrioformis]|uniref:TubC N-terminal docking domain-containing protein n=1 Tax=Oxalobacter vibrioformis TaxID=933080 RepID=A0A9E9LYY3_9BURK|nr:hypothetical protein [Oxalobacter vibrioformis]NLC24520.1 hypothetical protein [Oxalobacter sp.]WAW10240.1 hypothetical protein NB640_00810 [Oxalobacter vibrioformis]
MNIARLIAYCREHGIEFCLGNGTVKVRGTADIIEEILPVLRAHKKEIIDHLSIEMIHAGCLPEVYYRGEPVYTEAQADLALVKTQALLNRVMSKSA